MPTTSCGFPPAPGHSSSQQLEQWGPTLSVLVGFDPQFRAGSDTPPKLPSTLIPALVDTGAAISCIDTNLVKSLNLPLVGTQKFSGMAGSSDRTMHLAQIRVPTLNANIYGDFAAVDLLAGGQPHALLLGRSFLSHFRITYDRRSGDVIIENETPLLPPHAAPSEYMRHS